MLNNSTKENPVYMDSTSIHYSDGGIIDLSRIRIANKVL